MHWINTKNRLPEEGKYVIARHNRGTWKDGTDQENVNCVVVKLVKGISLEWKQFGPDSFSGQTITHWMPIEPINEK